MQLSEYNLLEVHQKARILGSPSVFLKSYMDEDINASLYAYNNFYIEVLWDSNTNNIIEILAFKNGVRLDKYLERINLSDLVTV